MEAVAKVGAVALVFSIFARFVILSESSSLSSNGLRIVSAERRIDLTSHIVNVFLTLKVENKGASSASEIFLAFPPTQFDHLSLLKAALTVGKRKKKSYQPLTVIPTELPDAPNGAKYFSIYLLKPMGIDEILTHSLEPFPAEIKQSESQFVYFRDSALILSPYHIKQQTTYIKTPSAQVESYTRVEPTDRANTKLKYGPYNDRPSYSYSPIIVHFENNSPFAVVEELVREVEISHWGNLQITERYKLVHAGARHKGMFSRIEYQSKPSISGASSFRHLLARLPPRVHSVYYRDEIGNISTSRLRTDSRKSELEIEPRYPLFGGWKATFVIGYGLPLQDFLFESPDGRRYLNFSFGCPIAEIVDDKLTIKVVPTRPGERDESANERVREMEVKKAGSSLDALIVSFNSRMAELQDLVIARNMYPASSITDLSAVDAALKAMELQIQAIKDRLREETQAIPKAKKLIDASLRQQKKLQKMSILVPSYLPERVTVLNEESSKCSLPENSIKDPSFGPSKLEEELLSLPKEKKSRAYPPLWYVTADELDSLSSYMRGRLTLEKVNAAINDMATYAEANAQLISAPRKKLAENILEKALELRDIATKEPVKSKHFFLENDIKGPALKLDNTGKAILTVLRHLGRITETRIGHHRVFILSKLQ